MSLSSINPINVNKTQNFYGKKTVKNFAFNNLKTKNPYNDGIDDGKITLKNALKHFKDGIIAPFKQLFSSPKNLAIGAATIAAGALLCAMLPTMLPVMTAIGLTIGGIQIGAGIYKAVTAKKDKDAENAWESIGMGTFSFATSALGAKNALKTAGIKDTQKLTIAQACIKCFKDIPSNISKSFKMIKNKTAFANIKNAFKRVTFNKDEQNIELLKKAGYDVDKLDEVQLYAEKIHQEALEMTQGDNNCIDQLKAALPEEFRDKITFRVKEVESIKDKIIRKLVRQERCENLDYAKNLIEQVRGSNYITDNNLTPEQTIELAKKLAPKARLLVENLDDARRDIFDAIGVRLVADDLNDDKVKLIADAIARMMADGKIEFKIIKNYRGRGVEPYFNIDHLDILTEGASTQKKYQFYYRQGSGMDTKTSGYTTAQLLGEYNNGMPLEFQIRGSQIDKISQVEHLPYDIRMNKDITHDSPLLKQLYEKLTHYTKHLSDSGYNDLNDYLTALYQYYRQIELGKPIAKMPVIGDFINNPATAVRDFDKFSAADIQKIFSGVLKHLDINNVENLHNDSKWLRTIPRTKLLEVILHSARQKMDMDNLQQSNERIGKKAC